MKETHWGEVKKTECITDKIFCNKCGKPIEIIHNYGIVPHDVFQDHLSVFRHWYLNSNKNDEAWELCDKCYGELTSGFVIPVTRLL